MAVLGKIRQRSALIIVVIGLAMFAFLLPELLQNGFNIDSNNVGSINGKDVPIEQFRLKVENLEKSGQGVAGIQAVNRIWEQEVNLALITDEFDILGLRVGNSHILNVLKSDQQVGQNPMFQNEAGIFDLNKLNEFLKTNPEQKFFIESKEKDAEINSKYQIYSSMLKGGFYTTLNDAKFKYELQNKKVNFDFVSLPYSSINDSDVVISDQEITDYMKKNEKKFKADETREIEYVLIEDKPTDADKNEIKTKFNGLLNDRIAYNTETKQNDTIPGFSKTSNVIEFVNANSEIPYDSTYIAKADMPAEHAESLYNLEEGGIYGPYIFGEYYALSRSLGKKSGAKASASHILISYDGTQVQNQKEFRTKEEAKAKAEKLLADALKSPDDFKMLAMVNSDDTSGQQGGDLGFFNPGAMVKPFDDFVFNNPVGKIGLVETDFGFHIIQVTDKQDAIRLATIAQKIVPSKTTSDNAYNKALSIEMDANAKPFADVASSNKVEIQSVPKLKLFDENVASLGAQRAIVRWAFDKKTDINDVKRFDIADQGYVVARLKTINKEGLMPIADARMTVEPVLKNIKKATMLKEKIKGGTLESIATTNNVTVQQSNDVTAESPIIPGAGFEPKVVGTAFSTSVNTVSAPIEGVSGVYVVKTTVVTNALPTNNYSAQITALKSQGLSATGKIFTILKERADIKDNRAKFNY
jgi:peptidyl-prolyl cis-trans isomerase D